MASLRALELPCSSARPAEATRCDAFASAGNAALPRRAAPHLGAFLARPAQPTPARAAAQPRPAAVAAAAPSAVAEDKWIAVALEAAAPTAAAVAAPLASVRSACQGALTTLRMPSSKNEEYRFTDIAPLLATPLAAPPAADPATVAAAAAAHTLKQPVAARVVLVDGSIDAANTVISDLPAGVYVGPLAGAPADVVGFALGAQTRGRGGPFATLNGALARDAVVVHVPAGATVTAPIHVLSLSSAAAAAGTRAAAAPRILIVLEEGATAEVVEEYAPLAADQASASTASPSYLTTAVTEVELDDRAALKHSYVELEAPGAAHFKATLVNQGARSQYSLVEARIGGALTRHDIGVDQLGEATETAMKSFLLAGEGQLHDLHSKLKLDHPDGVAAQLHKCIAAAASARGVFDGNVRVNRLAQRTDAQQLSRNLLLVPRATVNVKPNLQIIADDVKCTHGCSVSDLEEEELFYLRSRGISAEAARQVLVYSFGREVVQHLRDEAVVGRVEAATSAALATVAAIGGQ